MSLTGATRHTPPETAANGALTLRGDGLDLVFRQAVDGDVRRWPGRAREVAARQLELWKLGGLVDDARLVVSELISNAVCHGHGDTVTLRLTYRSGGVRLDVETGAAGDQPRVWGPGNLPSPVEDDENGRGLLLVQAFADDWDISEDGSRVWCTLTAAATPAAEPECEAAG
ncbi:ATP-binding protein [Streptomyces sp. S07_1.15]|uniref:ATP-binding protein n=1 Tax=Streptomyces sp. S07_1.15 TaxID=2873925 RepID=UPI001D13B5D6|nr:ATP-binding protein [Streptomyces sp. S07_1.15]MCC3653923.1 ATP-binding protein [Streptomyces sp. S07_1.15]